MLDRSCQRPVEADHDFYRCPLGQPYYPLPSASRRQVQSIAATENARFALAPGAMPIGMCHVAEGVARRDGCVTAEVARASHSRLRAVGVVRHQSALRVAPRSEC